MNTNPNMVSNAVEMLRDANHIYEMDEFKKWQFPASFFIWAAEFTIVILAALAIMAK